MKLLKITLLSALLLLPASAWGDYDPPTFDEMANWCTAIVDATVEDLVTREIPLETGSYKRQEVRLKIHRHVYGEKAPSTLTGVAMTCIDEGQLHHIVSPKTRYILCLKDNELLEGSTCYAVREADGKAECLYRDARSPAEAAWMRVSDLEEKLRAAQASISAIISTVTGLKGEAVRIPMELRSWIAEEIVVTGPVGGGGRGAMVRKAYEKLSPSRTKKEREEGFEELVKLEGWGCLLSCATWHEDDALRSRAVSLFEVRKEKYRRNRIVRALLPLIENSRGPVAGGTEAQLMY